MELLRCVAYGLPFTPSFYGMRHNINKMGLSPFIFLSLAHWRFIVRFVLEIRLCGFWFINLYVTFKLVCIDVWSVESQDSQYSVFSLSVTKCINDRLAFW